MVNFQANIKLTNFVQKFWKPKIWNSWKPAYISTGRVLLVQTHVLRCVVLFSLVFHFIQFIFNKMLNKCVLAFMCRFVFMRIILRFLVYIKISFISSCCCCQCVVSHFFLCFVGVVGVSSCLLLWVLVLLMMHLKKCFILKFIYILYISSSESHNGKQLNWIYKQSTTTQEQNRTEKKCQEIKIVYIKLL